MSVSSGTYLFNNVTIQELFDDVFQTIGKPTSQIGGEELKAIKRQANLMFTDWQNKGLNLWTNERVMIQLVPNQAYYKLPTGTITVRQASAAQLTRQLTGTAFSSSGVAANAFDANFLTTCTTTDVPPALDFIGFNFGDAPQNIWYVGIATYVTATYALVVEYSYNGTDYYVSDTVVSQRYIQGTIEWIVLTAPPLAPYWRVRCTAGNALNLAELYFMTPSLSRLVQQFSDQEWVSLTNKTQQGSLTNYYVDRLKEPVMIMWPIPNAIYPFFAYERKRYIQDVEDLTINMDAPQRFYDAITTGLAARMALKYALDKYTMLNELAVSTFEAAVKDDFENVPLRIMPDYIGYNGR